MVDREATASRRQILGYGAVGAGTIFAGCVGGEPPENGTGDDGSNGGSGSGDGEFVYLTTQQPSSIDPARSLDELEGIYNSTVYDPLVRVGYEFPPEITSSVAADWELANDNTTYTFNLQEGLTFHNGDPVTADDVKYSIDRTMEINQGPTWMWSGLITEDSVSVVDETTVEIQLEQPFAPFEQTLAWMFIYNQEQVESEGDDWLEDNAAGSGPFALESYNRGEIIELSRNDDWWGEFTDNVADTVVMDIGLEPSTIVGGLTNGEGHLTDRWLSVPNYEEFETASSTHLSETETFNTYYVFMNMRKAPLDDVRVRRAISYAFDYETAMSILGTDASLNGPMPETMKHATTEGVPQYEQDFDAAQEELEQSEYDIEDIEVTYVSQPAIGTNQDIGLMIEDQFSEVGITVNLEDAPWSRIVELASDPEASPQMFPLWGQIEYNDPDAYLWSMWHSSAVNTYLNGSNYESGEMDSLLVEGRRTVDEDERADIYQEVQQIIMEDAPAIMVANDMTRFGYHEDVSGFTDSGIMGYTHQFQRMGLE